MNRIRFSKHIGHSMPLDKSVYIRQYGITFTGEMQKHFPFGTVVSIGFNEQARVACIKKAECYIRGTYLVNTSFGYKAARKLLGIVGESPDVRIDGGVIILRPCGSPVVASAIELADYIPTYERSIR